MKDVEGKVAFITGGSSGIGLGIARAFADAGMKVVISYRTRSHLDEAMRHLASAAARIHAIDVDVTDRPGMEKAAEEAVRVFGKVHVLVANAGVAHSAALGEITYDDWDWVLNVNVTGVFNGVHAFLPHIRSHGEGGHILATSSIMGLCAFGSLAAAYSVSKFAVVGFMEVLRAELACTNIGVSVFCPGMVSSNLQDSGRHRPGHLTGVQVKESKLDPEIATDPLETGRLVLRGMRNNDLFILTHPEYEPMIRLRDEVLIASTTTDLKPTKTRLELARSWLDDSIYAAERERQRRKRSGGAT